LARRVSISIGRDSNEVDVLAEEVPALVNISVLAVDSLSLGITGNLKRSQHHETIIH
jgi:hypothetical protein